MKDLAERLFDGDAAKGRIEDMLETAGVPFERIGWDHYDSSLEIYEVGPDYRMPPEIQENIFDMGFAKVYVNHTDKWETHYSWKPVEFKSSRGWRRRYVQDPSATTTNVIVGPPNPGYYEISHWPDGWPKEWLETGYMRIVPDPLEPAS